MINIQSSRHFLVRLGVLLVMTASLAQMGTGSVSPVRAQSLGPDVGEPVEPVVFDKPLSVLPVSSGFRPGDPIRERPFIIDPGYTPSGNLGSGDALKPLSLQEVAALTPVEFSTPNPNFEGMNLGDQPFGLQPPDTNGDVGPDDYVQTVNVTVEFFDKLGGTRAGPTTLANFFAPLGAPCGTVNDGDPIVQYDHLADRWLISQFTLITDGNHQCIAISQGPDPVNDGWYFYDFTLPADNDYFKFGVWPDAYYMSSQRGFPGSGLDLYAFDRANMLNGGPAAFQRFFVAAPSLVLLPSDLNGPPPPAGAPALFARHIDGDEWGGADRIEIFEFHVDWGVPANSTCGVAGGPAVCGAPDFTLPTAGFDANLCAAGALGDPCVPQPGTAQLLDTIPHWSMYRLQYRNFGSYQAMVFNHTVDVDGTGHAGVRWYELRDNGGGWSIFQQSTHSPDAGNPGLVDDVFRWMGSIAMDKAGNIALGYSVSDGNTVFPSIRYAGRQTGDPLGTLPHGEFTIFNGAGSQAGNRWGDYSAMQVDPADDCTFWYTTEYIDAGGNWRTRIAAFRFPSCNPADLEIFKFDHPDPVNAGEQLYYDITVVNHGPNIATNVVVTDTLPAGVDYITDTDSCVEGPPGTLVCSLGTILPGDSSSFTIKVAIPHDFIANTGPVGITNTATVAGDQLDPNPNNNTATATTIVEDLADLKMTKECKPDGTAPTGSNLTCTLFVENLGPSTARDVNLRDEIVSSGLFTITDIDDDPSRTDICSPVAPYGPTASATIECSLDEPLEPKSPGGGGSWVISYVITATEPQDVNNCAQVFTIPGSTPDPNPANNQSCDGVRFTGVADLSLTKVDNPDPLDSGTTITYTLEVTNNGPSTAVNVVVYDILPAGVSIVSVSGTGGASCVFGVPGDASRPTTCTFDSLAPSANATMTIVVTVNIPGVLNVAHNDASVSSDVFDPDNSNNVASQDTTIMVADLKILKTSDADVYKPSSTVKYTVTVWNDGPADAENVVVTDNLPDFKQAVFQFVDPNVCTKSNATLTCGLGTIPAGGSMSFDIYMTIKGNQGQVSNTASVVSTTFDPNAANNSSTRVVLIKGGVHVGMVVNRFGWHVRRIGQ